MQTEARVGVVVEGGGQRSLSSVQGGARNYSTEQKGLQQGPQIGTVPNLLAGGVAGAVSKTCTAPLARLTILFQVQGMHSDVATLSKPSMCREVYRILTEEGVRAFWKGNMLLRMVPGLDSHQNDNASADVLLRLLGGGLAGITAATVTYPLDLVRTRLAAQTKNVYYRGMSHALYAICRDEGMRGLYKGLGATLLGVGPSIAISFSVYDTLKSHWRSERPQDSPVLVSLACGSLSGIASSTATFPLDLVRRRKQLEGAGGRACVYNSGLLGTFRHIIRIEGFRGLYRGILPEYYKVVPSVGIVFMTYETLKSYLSGPVAND